MNKRGYYSKKNIVENYYSLRYSGRSGHYVNSRELAIIKKLLPEEGRILDVPSGNGRMASIFNSRCEIVGVDYSREMLSACNYQRKICSDVIKLPFKSNTFDVVLCIRFSFHYKNILPYLEELTRIIKKGGIIIFETYRWSPRKVLNIKSLGGKTFPLSDRNVYGILEKLNLSIVEKKQAFLFSPFIYKHLPYFFITFLDVIEKIVPCNLMVDVYWKVKKN